MREREREKERERERKRERDSIYRDHILHTTHPEFLAVSSGIRVLRLGVRPCPRSFEKIGFVRDW